MHDSWAMHALFKPGWEIIFKGRTKCPSLFKVYILGPSCEIFQTVNCNTVHVFLVGMDIHCKFVPLRCCSQQLHAAVVTDRQQSVGRTVGRRHPTDLARRIADFPRGMHACMDNIST